MYRIKQKILPTLLIEHIINNKKEYIVSLLIFIIGIFVGVLYINNIDLSQKDEIGTYINSFIKNINSVESINFTDLLKNSILQNVLLACAIWFFGTTVIGIPIVYGIVLYRGFCLGYTISICVFIMGVSKGLLFIISSLLLQNIIIIPVILALAVSGYKLYRSIMKDKRKENIKIEIIRHTIFSIIMILFLIIASFIEVFISTNVLKIIAKYF